MPILVDKAFADLCLYKLFSLFSLKAQHILKDSLFFHKSPGFYTKSYSKLHDNLSRVYSVAKNIFKKFS